jgi:hypothetical protein
MRFDDVRAIVSTVAFSAMMPGQRLHMNANRYNTDFFRPASQSSR